MPTRSRFLEVRLFTVASRRAGGMDQSNIEQAMQRAVAAVGRECRSHAADRNLIQKRPDGWYCRGSVSLMDSSKAWQVYWHPELERGWLWGIVRLKPHGVMPRRFQPPR
jgi:hypothetical protein